MIYIKYQKDEFCVDKGGQVVPVSTVSVLDYAVFTDTSKISIEQKIGYRCFSYNKNEKLYYLENKAFAKDNKSLFHALNARPGIVCGLFFSKRLILFYYSNGNLNIRFTSDNIDDPAGEINYTIKRWGVADNSTLEVYGFNIQWDELYSRIQNAPSFKDIYKEKKKRQAIQVIAGAIVFGAVLTGWGAIKLKVSSVKSAIEQTKKNTQNNIISSIRNEMKLRLPLYLDSMIIPLDRVLKDLSFLEQCKYSNINIIVNNDGSISVTVSADKPIDAYKIYALAGDGSTVKYNGGKIEVTFNRHIQKGSGISDSSDYTRYFSF